MSAVSTLLGGNNDAIVDISDELMTLGFPASVSTNEVEWGSQDWTRLLQGIAAPRETQQSRAYSWESLQNTARPNDAVAFVLAVLGSQLERESAAAAATLWRRMRLFAQPTAPPFGPPQWTPRDDFLSDPDWFGFDWLRNGPLGPIGIDSDIETSHIRPWDSQAWVRTFSQAMLGFTGFYEKVVILSLLAQRRLADAVRSPDPVTRSLAGSAFVPSDSGLGRSPSAAQRRTGHPRAGQASVSTMIHGTFGWKGDWWRPGPARFHDFILSKHRPNLYSGGARFSWSGAYSDPQRALAASDFGDWTAELARNGIDTVFGHSYGGEVAARAKLNGVAINQIALLSSPVTQYVQALSGQTDVRVVDIRLNFDPVLAIVGARQRIRPSSRNITEVIFNKWRMDHGATHEESAWTAESVATRGNI